jgi:endonuclease/exonuclease/phosphatase family metal-dependent hydrolase
VFFQEVIPSSYRILKESLEEQYALFCAVDVNNMKFLDPRTYFTMILMNKDTCELDGESKIIPYTNTCMSRNLLKARLRYRKKISITAMTSHLESTADYTKQRTEQLRLCFSEMLAEKDESYVLFGGDLNLRDAEVSKTDSKCC